MIQNKKNKELIIKLPKKSTKRIANTDMFFNNFKDDTKGLFFQNNKKGTKLKEDTYICLTKQSLLSSVVINGNENHHVCFDVTKSQLKQLLKKVEQSEAYFKKLNNQRKKDKMKSIGNSFFVHLNPELSFFVKTK